MWSVPKSFVPDIAWCRLTGLAPPYDPHHQRWPILCASNLSPNIAQQTARSSLVSAVNCPRKCATPDRFSSRATALLCHTDLPSLLCNVWNYPLSIRAATPRRNPNSAVSYPGTIPNFVSTLPTGCNRISVRFSLWPCNASADSRPSWARKEPLVQAIARPIDCGRWLFYWRDHGIWCAPFGPTPNVVLWCRTCSREMHTVRGRARARCSWADCNTPVCHPDNQQPSMCHWDELMSTKSTNWVYLQAGLSAHRPWWIAVWFYCSRWPAEIRRRESKSRSGDRSQGCALFRRSDHPACRKRWSAPNRQHTSHQHYQCSLDSMQWRKLGCSGHQVAQFGPSPHQPTKQQQRFNRTVKIPLRFFTVCTILCSVLKRCH